MKHFNFENLVKASAIAILLLLLVIFVNVLRLDKQASAETPKITLSEETSGTKSEIEFDQYIWQNLSPDALEPSFPEDNLYLPIVYKINDNIEDQTGISLQDVVDHGGSVHFNFFYTDNATYYELVEVIILTEDGKIIEDFLLRYTEEDLKINRKAT